MTLTLISQHRCFDGIQSVYSHASNVTGCVMRFGLFLPPEARLKSVPALYWLSGLTCTEDNFIVKANAQRMASQLGLAIIVPDTSPRGLGVALENERYDLGLGAGFYVDATEAPWSPGYRMYRYTTQELPALIADHFPIDTKKIGIFGHSMGGHGALVAALRNPDAYQSVSAFAPISSSMQSPWGEQALTRYLGPNKNAWYDYDAAALIKKLGWKKSPILIDQGTQDPYLETQLKPQLLSDACEEAGVTLNLRMQEGYDHSYFFITTFIEDHLRFHAQHLR